MSRILFVLCLVLIAIPGTASAFVGYGQPGYYQYWGYQPPLNLPPPSGITVYHYHDYGYTPQSYHVHRRCYYDDLEAWSYGDTWGYDDYGY